MKTRIALGLLLASLGIAVMPGCYVHEERVHERHCAGGVWVDGHYGPRGVWHEGHWRCPGVVERIEID